MPTVFHVHDLPLTERRSAMEDFVWFSSERLSHVAGSERLVFDIRSLSPGKFSFPYHFHRHAEELFFIVSGSCTLRSPDGFTVLPAGSLVHFEAGPAGAHQLYNHGDVPCLYLDCRTFSGVDITEYPDSGKIGLLPTQEFFRGGSQVDYLEGEDAFKANWPDHILRRQA